MTFPPTLDLDALAQPLPAADAPGGVAMDGKLKVELEQLRKPAAAPADGGASSRPNADFTTVLRRCVEALAGTSKDLGLVVRLIEANTRVHEAAGLRDGLALAARLVRDGWDWVHPRPKHDADAGRGNAFKWLNAANSGAEFPQTVLALPLVECGADRFSYFDTLNPARVGEMDAALGKCDDGRLRGTLEAFTAADAALTELSKALRRRLGADDAPDFHATDLNMGDGLGLAIRNCLRVVSGVAARRNVSLDGPAAPSDAAAATAGAGAPAAARPTEADSRDGLYAQLERIAAALRRVEPNSPVPFLVERCVKLGRLPFPEMIREMLKDRGAADDLDRQLGLSKDD